MHLLKIVCASLVMVLAAAAQAGEAPRSTAATQFTRDIPNIPGKKFLQLVVSYPPGGKSPSHRHAKSAFIYAYVIEGEIRSAVDDGAPKVYKVGEGWHEDPGAHHRVSENASSTAPAKMLVVMVLDSGETVLTTPDPQ